VQFGAAFANELFDDAVLAVCVPAAAVVRGDPAGDRPAVVAWAQPGGLDGGAAVRAHPRRDELELLRGAAPTAARRRGDDRVHRPARGRGSRLTAVLDGLWVLLAGAGVVLLALRGGHHGIHAAGLGWRWSRRRAGRCTSCCRSGWAGRSPSWTASPSPSASHLVVLPAGIIQGGDALLLPHVVAGGLGVALLSSLIPYSLELHGAAGNSRRTDRPADEPRAGGRRAGRGDRPGQPLTAVLGFALVLVAAASVGNTLTARRLPQPQPEA